MQERFDKFGKMDTMEIKELKEKIISKLMMRIKDVLEEVLLPLSKNKDGAIINILKWKEKIFTEDENLFKRLS